MLLGLRPVAPLKEPAHRARGNAAFQTDILLRGQKQTELPALQSLTQRLIGLRGKACPGEDQLRLFAAAQRSDRGLRGQRRAAAADDDERIAERADLPRRCADREDRTGHHALRRVQPAEKIRPVRRIGAKLHMRVKQILFPGQQIRQTDASPDIR